MPKAVANTTAHVTKDLKSVSGGYVTLRQMNYGQIVARREMMKMSITAAKGSKDFTGEMAMASAEITRFEFQQCIVEHNLEDEDGRNLNLGSPVDFGKLDPRVGQEIEKLISDMNKFEDMEDDLGD